MGALFAGFAHEIRNPLSTIGLNLQLVKEEFADADSTRDKRVLRRLTVVESEVQRLQGILEEFLGFVRIPELERRSTNLQALIEELVEFTQPEMDEAGISLRTFVDNDLPDVDVDAGQIRAVLVNLVRNAREAMPEGGQIMIALRRENDAAVVQVTDSGEGMPADVREQAFLPYFSTKKSGTGLGLPTARRILEQHGGSIELASDEGKGTQFTLRVPLVPISDPRAGIARFRVARGRGVAVAVGGGGRGHARILNQISDSGKTAPT